MGELALGLGSRGRSSPAVPATNRVCSRSPNLLLRSSAAPRSRPPSLDETPCPCATPGSRPASWAGRGSTRARSRTHLYHNRSRCTGPRSRPSCFSRTGRFVVAGRPWSRRAPPGRRTGRSPACLPFPHSTAGGFEARRGSRATRAVPCASGRQPGGSAGGLGTARRDTGWGQPKNQGPARTANLWFVGVHELLSTRDSPPPGSLLFLLVSYRTLAQLSWNENRFFTQCEAASVLTSA